MIIERIKELTEELLHHCRLYYDLDNPVLSDAEYDRKCHELERLENEANFWLANSPTRKVQGSVLDCFNKIEHSKPMLSAAKTKDINEIKKFLGNHNFYCSFKLDGLTLITRYKDGKFVQAVTRGTGIIGEDVTEQAKMITNLPMNIPYDGDLELRGECVVSWDNFNKINENLENKYSHPRNLAAGSLRNLDTNITKERNLSYIVFECVTDLEDVDGLMDSKYMELKWLKQIGFDVVEACMCSAEESVKIMEPSHYIFPVDGLIFEFDSRLHSKSLASTSHHEGCRMALKWADEVHETKLIDVEGNTTRTGLISPVAIFDEIDLDGALTTRATLHNLSIIKQLELGIGDTITVYRSNMVIPKIDDNLTRSNTLAIPNKCPCCGSETIIKDTDSSQVLMCPNPDCSAKKIAQFTHFVSRKCMNIDGLSEKTLETLISHGFLRNFKDIYHLSKHRQQLIRLDGFGQKSIDHLLKSIEDSRNVRLENFIAALGIPNIEAAIWAKKKHCLVCCDDLFMRKYMRSEDIDAPTAIDTLICLGYSFDFIIDKANVLLDVNYISPITMNFIKWVSNCFSQANSEETLGQYSLSIIDLFDKIFSIADQRSYFLCVYQQIIDQKINLHQTLKWIITSILLKHFRSSK